MKNFIIEALLILVRSMNSDVESFVVSTKNIMSLYSLIAIYCDFVLSEMSEIKSETNQKLALLNVRIKSEIRDLLCQKSDNLAL